MNILYFEHYAGSLRHGRSFRPHYLGREIVRAGHRMTVVGASYSHLRHTQPDCESEEIDGIHYIWLKTPEYKGNSLSRFLSMLHYPWRIFQERRRILDQSRPDVIVCSTVYMFDIFPAWLMAKRTGAKLVFELHDLWPLTLIEVGGMSKFHPLVVVLGLSERFVYKVADHVISMLPGAYAHMQHFGLKAEQFTYIPNGIALEDEQSAMPIPEFLSSLAASLRHKGLFVAGYAGQISVSNALYDLLETARLLQNDPIHFVLIGDGQERADLESKARAMGLNNVTFAGRIPKSCVLNSLRAMDALYIGWMRQPLYRFGVSANKIFDYMLSGRPIVHAITAANDPVAEAGCGLSVPAESPQKTADAFRTLLGFSSAQREKMGQKGRDFVLRHHEYGILAQTFITAVGKQSA